MSKLTKFLKELSYNRMVFEILSQREVPYLVIHSSTGRTIEAHTRIPGFSILITTTPMEDGKVLLIVKPTGMKMFVEEIPEILLKQKLLKYVGTLL
ncbi:hypothetical protein SEA_CRUNCHYBOI_25 [Microbacterium phage CrunchyBoi]|nr:hypothetical protein SEA_PINEAPPLEPLUTO_25 [Microbacterium phage PineapplePluto]QQO39368.1 hypothetical protein SEA_CRUNCHYBOI_25 [Microbacterium phage CrunchyBoi]